VRPVISRQTLLVASRGPAASVASQAIGLLQIGLLLLHGGVTNATDTYFYLFTLGLTPILILVMGVMYPMLLNGQPISRRGLRRIRLAATFSAVACVLGGYGWLAANREMDATLLIVAVFLSANAVLQAQLYSRAAAAEAGGNALWISGIALPANVGACAALAWPWGSSNAATIAMVAGLVIGNAGSLAFITQRRVGQEVLDAVPVDAPANRGSLWFFGKASTGYVSQGLLATLAVTLPASSVTVLSVASKVVGALAATLINSVMPVLVHQATQSTRAARRFLRLLVCLLVVAGALATVAARIVAPDYLLAVIVISVWTISASAAAVAQRTSFRFLPARAAGGVMAAILAIVALTTALATLPGFNLVVLLCAYASLDAATAALLLWPLKERAVGMIAVVLLICLAVTAGTALT
jgi:hypothetical protein